MKVLLVADLHLRADRPVCRLDEDWMESQRIDLQNIGHIIESNDVDEVWLLGDIFHHPVEPPEVVNLAISEIERWHVYAVRAICGNHDLRYHSMDNFCKNSIATLFESKTVQFFDDVEVDVNAYNFGQETTSDSDIILTHQLVFPNDNARGLAGGKVPGDIYEQFPEAKAVLMGDYHDGWDLKHSGQLQIMVGCMNIQSGKLESYLPRVVLFDTETLEYQTIYLQQDHVKITTDHIVEAKARDERLEACMNTVSSMESVDFDFIGNLRELARSNNKVEPIINELLTELNK